LQSAATLLQGFGCLLSIPTGSRIHPWLYAGIPLGFNRNTVTRAPLDGLR
jgi:hypothetical protein